MSKSKSRNKPEISIDEYIALIRHSNIPTIVVEGKDDVIVYRRIEAECGIGEASILPVDGRTKIISMFRRWEEVKHTVRGFIADRDTWIITGVPPEFDDSRIILTTGYSIENDAYIDGDLEKYLYDDEVEKFSNELDLFAKWYALALDRHLANQSNPIDDHPKSVLDGDGRYESMTKLLPEEAYPHALHNRIKHNYKLEIRGKSLIDLLIRQLSYKGRPVNHHSKNLLEFVSVNRGKNLNMIFDKAFLLLGKKEYFDGTTDDSYKHHNSARLEDARVGGFDSPNKYNKTMRITALIVRIIRNLIK